MQVACEDYCHRIINKDLGHCITHSSFSDCIPVVKLFYIFSFGLSHILPKLIFNYLLFELQNTKLTNLQLRNNSTSS